MNEARSHIFAHDTLRLALDARAVELDPSGDIQEEIRRYADGRYAYAGTRVPLSTGGSVEVHNLRLPDSPTDLRLWNGRVILTTSLARPAGSRVANIYPARTASQLRARVDEEEEYLAQRGLKARLRTAHVLREDRFVDFESPFSADVVCAAMILTSPPYVHVQDRRNGYVRIGNSRREVVGYDKTADLRRQGKYLDPVVPAMHSRSVMRIEYRLLKGASVRDDGVEFVEDLWSQYRQRSTAPALLLRLVEPSAIGSNTTLPCDPTAVIRRLVESRSQPARVVGDYYAGLGFWTESQTRSESPAVMFSRAGLNRDKTRLPLRRLARLMRAMGPGLGVKAEECRHHLRHAITKGRPFRWPTPSAPPT